MSIIMTGKNMPKSCAECQDQRCKAADEWDQFDWCDYERVDGCPLKSTDGLIKKIEQLDFDFGDYYDHTTEIINKVVGTIKEYCETEK